jgi:hypothetical protein
VQLSDRIIRQRAAIVAGPYAGEDYDWDNPAELAMPAEVVSPTSDEDVQNAQRVSAQYVVVTYPDADVTPVDRVEWRGEVYEVASGVDQLSAHGVTRALRFLIRRVTGG